jgi:oxygen-dependent protoporphyrinogen oxidase
MHDAVIVGGGIAGLSAAWRLRAKDILVLEADARPGGRIYSQWRGQYPLNFGAHVYPGGRAPIARLMDEVGVEAYAIPGNLTALHLNGKLLKTGRPDTYPLRAPMSMRARLALARLGPKLFRASRRFSKDVTLGPDDHCGRYHESIMSFMGDQSFADLLGPLPPDADTLFRSTATRTSGELEEQSASSGLGLFSFVWSKGGGFGRNIVGGPSALPLAIAARLGDAIRYETTVHEVRQTETGVVVDYEHGGKSDKVEARRCIMATPAFVTASTVVGLPAETAEALRALPYGPCVVVSYLTNETTRQPWDDCYAIAVGGKKISMIFNSANLYRSVSGPREPGGTLMTYSMATEARRQLERSDAEIVATYTDEVSSLFPAFGEIVEEAVVKRWSHMGPYLFPGRYKLQPALTRPLGRIHLAGDYLGFPSTDTATYAGFMAAQTALCELSQMPHTELDLQRT